jgi:pyruvate,water dikinase
MPTIAAGAAVATAPPILWLGSPGSTERTIVGSESAHLSALAAIERVPPGFAITADAFRGLHPGQPLPEGLRWQIGAAYRALARLGGRPHPEVAVRPSVIDEGDAGASFTHKLTACLNVVGEQAVIDAVEASWTSWSEQTLTYRHPNSMEAGRSGFSVLVQRMVLADVTATVFSVNPVGGSPAEAIVTATWGLGESLAGGTATPDAWVVRRDSFELREQRIGAKRRMTVPSEEGVREVAVPPALSRLPSLSSRQVAELVELAVTLETRMGWPVDVECAYRDGELYLLQCRPIMTPADFALAA